MKVFGRDFVGCADDRLGCDGVCVVLAIVGCGVYASDASTVVFGMTDLAVAVAWYCCGVCCVLCDLPNDRWWHCGGVWCDSACDLVVWYDGVLCCWSYHGV